MYMSDMIDERQKSNIERHDVFSNFIAANNENVDLTNLTKSEIIGACSFFVSKIRSWTWTLSFLKGNIYMFLLAGHEVCLFK